MAVVNVVILFAGATGDVKYGWSNGSFTRKFQIIYQVQTNNAADDFGVIMASGSLPQIGAAFPQDMAGQFSAGAICTELKPARDPKSRQVWTVTANYESPPLPSDTKNKDANNPNPLTWQDEFKRTPAKFTEPVTEAYLRAGPNGGAICGFAVGAGPMVPITAAGDAYNPPPERDQSRALYQITKYLATYPSKCEAFEDTVNSSFFGFTKGGSTFAIAEYRAKFEPFEATLKYHRAYGNTYITYWECVFTLSVINRSWGWRLKLPNVDVDCRAMAGDPDGHGGTIPYQPGQSGGGSGGYAPGGGALPGVPSKRRMKDNGVPPRPISHPVPLDLNGQPLPPGAQHTYIYYSVYKEQDFSSLQFSQDNAI